MLQRFWMTIVALATILATAVQAQPPSGTLALDEVIGELGSGGLGTGQIEMRISVDYPAENPSGVIGMGNTFYLWGSSSVTLTGIEAGHTPVWDAVNWLIADTRYYVRSGSSWVPVGAPVSLSGSDSVAIEFTYACGPDCYGMLPGFNDQAFWIRFETSAGDHSGTVCLDGATSSSSLIWLWYHSLDPDFEPDWAGLQCLEVSPCSSEPDADSDGVGDLCDLCTDTDDDGLGDPGYPVNTCPPDLCPSDPDNDVDGDGVCGEIDNCELYANPGQGDVDTDGVGDVCDNCWHYPNSDQFDFDANCPDPPYSYDPQCGDPCQDAWICGDVNGTDNVGGEPTVGDIGYLFDHLHEDGDGRPLANPWVCDVDNVPGITNNDVMKLADHLWYAQSPLDCTPVPDSVFPASADSIEARQSYVLPGETDWPVMLWMKATRGFPAISVPVTWDCATSELELDSVILNAADLPERPFVYDHSAYQIDGASQSVAIGIAPIGGYETDSLPEGNWLLATLWFSIETPSSLMQYIHIQPTQFLPNGQLVLSALDEGTIYGVRPVFLEGALSDSDEDGVVDGIDICIYTPNTSQLDSDDDGVGNACDNCWFADNPSQDDTDQDCPDPPYMDNPKCGDACPGCCEGRVGNANGLGGDEPTIGDISVMIDAKFITGTCDGILECFTEADVNQSGGIDADCDDITISDISTLIDYLFITGPSLWLPECL